MLLGGLWHGAAWNFVIWGGLHGALLASSAAREGGALRRVGAAAVRGRLTFTLVLITWVFFRARTCHAAMRYLGDMAVRDRRRPARAARRGRSISPTTSERSAGRRSSSWSAPQTWDWTRTLTPPRRHRRRAVLLSVVC